MDNQKELINVQIQKANSLLEDYNDIKSDIYSIAHTIVSNPSSASVQLITSHEKANNYSKELVELMNEDRNSLFYLYRLSQANISLDTELGRIRPLIDKLSQLCGKEQ